MTRKWFDQCVPVCVCVCAFLPKLCMEYTFQKLLHIEKQQNNNTNALMWRLHAYRFNLSEEERFCKTENLPSSRPTNRETTI